MLRRQRSAVHGVRNQNLLAHRLVQRQAAREVMLDAVVEAAIGAVEDDLLDAIAQPGPLQQPGERHAGPLGSRDAFLQPGHRRVTGRDLAAAVAGALQSGAYGQAVFRSELGERHGKGPLHQAADAEAPALVGRRDIEVDQQVVQSGWRDVVAQCLERHAMIARSQLDFLGRIAPNDGRAAG